MGAFYNSICIPGDQRQRVQESLQRWLGARGFEPSTQPMLFDLDGETERSVFVIWNERWTILVYSKYEEERRLIRELQTWAPAVLYLWVQDSDAWGYDVFDAGGFAGSYTSDPRAWRSFPDEEIGTAERPATDPPAVAPLLGLDSGGGELRRIERQKAVFGEDVCLELCRLLGTEAALVSYDDLERGVAARLPGWRSEQLLFFHRPSVAPPACGTELHRISVGALATGGIFAGQSSHVEITPELIAEVEQLRRRARAKLRLLRPVSWLAKGWRWLREQAAPARSAVRGWLVDAPAAEPAPPAVVGAGERRQVNPRHGCEIVLADGAVFRPTSGKPAAVFAFAVDATTVTCTARRRWKIADVMKPPSRSEIVRDERFRTRSGLAARHVLFKLPPRYMAGTQDASFLGLHVVESFQALYVFLYRFTRQLDPRVEEIVRATVESFRLQP